MKKYSIPEGMGVMIGVAKCVTIPVQLLVLYLLACLMSINFCFILVKKMSLLGAVGVVHLLD